MAQALRIDPALFGKEAITAETAAFNEQFFAQLAARPAAPEAERLAAYRAAMAAAYGGHLSPLAQERLLPGPHGTIPVRVFVPERVRGVYLDIHGGGWIAMSAGDFDPFNEHIAQSCDVAVVSVDYRLAPEHPYPTPVDDCEAVALWLVQHARAEFGVERLVIGGGSAGGQLSATTLLRLRDRHGYSGCAGANLQWGCYDLSLTPSNALGGPMPRWFIDLFVPDPALRRDPDVSPLYADLRGLPPALFTVGTLDPLLDDNLFMASRWVAAGNQAELAVYPGGVHGFNVMPHPLAQQANERMEAFIRAAVAEPVPA